MEGNGTFIPQAFTDLLLFHMNISCAFVSIILISFPLQSRAETENSKGVRDEGLRREEMSNGEREMMGVREREGGREQVDTGEMSEGDKMAERQSYGKKRGSAEIALSYWSPIVIYTPPQLFC